jgi:hypothetical protein
LSWGAQLSCWKDVFFRCPLDLRNLLSWIALWKKTLELPEMHLLESDLGVLRVR